MKFLHNQWYTAATSVELGEKPLARMVCNEPLVIFRGQDGNVAVLSDRCPHRKAPLSSGEVVGNDIQCGYHGCRCRRPRRTRAAPDRKSTRLNSSHSQISYAVFCLKKKKTVKIVETNESV